MATFRRAGHRGRHARRHRARHFVVTPSAAGEPMVVVGMDERPPSPPGAGGERLLVAVFALFAGVLSAVGFGARLACVVTGRPSPAGGMALWGEVTGRVARTGDLRAAWLSTPAGSGVATAGWLWAGTIVVFVVETAAVAVGLVWWQRTIGSADRVGPLGVERDARLADRSAVGPLVVDSALPPEGRMLLGRLTGPAGELGAYLATEDRRWAPVTARRRLGRRPARVQDRGSVALIGPTGSQKTQAIISAIAGFDGVVVAVSVKGDLYEATAAARARRGEIAVFDPSGATQLATARWSPLERATTVTGANKTGAALAQSIPKNGVTNADYWSKHGEDLLSSFIILAGLSRLLGPRDGWNYGSVGLEQIATWVAISAGADDPKINHLLRCAGRLGLPLEVQLMARVALTAFIGLGKQDPKIVSSVYTTARLAVNPWLEPGIAHSATLNPRPSYNSKEMFPAIPRYVDLDWLMADRPDGTSGTNTLYLSADSGDFERLAPVLGGLLADIKDQVHAWDIERRRLPKPLAIVIDETGQLGFNWLPKEVSTIAGLGAFYVTSWQSKSQIDAAYGALSDTVIAGHPTVIVFSGVKDPSTARWVLPQLGHAHVTRHSVTRDGPAGWGLLGGKERVAGRSVSQSRQREPIADEHVLREMPPGQAILIHRTLPAALIATVQPWENATIRALVPIGTDGIPLAPVGLLTCPLDPSSPPVTPPAETQIDRRTLDDALRLLPTPKPRTGRPGGPPGTNAAASGRGPDAPAPSSPPPVSGVSPATTTAPATAAATTAAPATAAAVTTTDPTVAHELAVADDVVVSPAVLFPDFAAGPPLPRHAPGVRPRTTAATSAPSRSDELPLDNDHAADVDNDDRVTAPDTEGGSDRAAGVNKRPGLCSLCGGLVAPFTGRQTGTRNGFAVVAHTPVCPAGPRR